MVSQLPGLFSQMQRAGIRIFQNEIKFFIMSYILKIVLVLALTWPTPGTINAQGESSPADRIRHHVGFGFGYGNQDLGIVSLDVDYDYQLFIFQAIYQYTVIQKTNWNLDFVAQPQYNLSKFLQDQFSTEEEEGFEFGLSLGNQIQGTFIRDRLDGYVLLISGPHFVSGVPDRQSKGFIFSTNLLFGFQIKLLDGLNLKLSSGIRHISNIGIKSPNGGVNDFMVYGGLLFDLQEKG